jgi:hypothetical protein
MVDEDGQGDWDVAEREQLRALAHAQPPREVEERVLRRLREDGAFGRRGVARWPLAAAASLVFFLAGWSVGVRRSAPVPDPRPLYMLLLYDVTPTPPEEEAARVSEYGAWARRVGAGGNLKGAEKLKDETIVLGPAFAGREEGTLGGFFVIAAETRERALEIARGCPHLRYGGRVVVRPVDPV